MVLEGEILLNIIVKIVSDCPHCSELECIVLLMHVLSKSFNMER